MNSRAVLFDLITNCSFMEYYCQLLFEHKAPAKRKICPCQVEQNCCTEILAHFSTNIFYNSTIYLYYNHF